MSENNRDKLEKFFNTRLNEDSVDSDWNKPSDDVFFSAMDVLDAQQSDRKNRRNVLLLLLLALLLSGIIGIAFYQISHLKKENQSLTQDFALLEESHTNQEQQLSNTTESLNQKTAELKVLKEQNDILKEKNTVLTQQVSQLERESKNQQIQIQSAINKNAELIAYAGSSPHC